VKSAYRKFIDQIAADAVRAGAAVPHPPVYTWLAGSWAWQGRPVRFAHTEYGISRDGNPFLIHNASTGMWVLVLADPGAFGILIGLTIRNAQVRFTGDVTIEGEPIRLRQTWRILNDNEVEIRNERMTDSLWQLWDCAILARVTPLD
jgi:hypothetical protein